MFPRSINGEIIVLRLKPAPSLLVLMGSMDWLTTIVGIVYFGAVEGNPFIADIARTNLPAFTVIKLGTAFFVAFLFHRAEKTLNQAKDKESKSFTSVRYLLKGTYAASIIFLLAAVLNNVLAVISLSK